MILVLSLITGQNPLFHFFAGSLMLGACFMATDPMTSPKFHKGQIIFGAGVGLIIMSMRWWGWQTPGVYKFTEGTARLRQQGVEEAEAVSRVRKAARKFSLIAAFLYMVAMVSVAGLFM